MRWLDNHLHISLAKTASIMCLVQCGTLQGAQQNKTTLFPPRSNHFLLLFPHPYSTTRLAGFAANPWCPNTFCPLMGITFWSLASIPLWEGCFLMGLHQHLSLPLLRPRFRQLINSLTGIGSWQVYSSL